MRVKDIDPVAQQKVSVIVEAALRHNVGLELPQCSGGGVTRVGELGKAVLFAVFIHALERFKRHHHFAAHFKVGGQPGLLQGFGIDAERNRAHGAHIAGNVFAHRAIAAADGALQFAVFIPEGQ